MQTSVLKEVGDLGDLRDSAASAGSDRSPAGLRCPACQSVSVAQVLGDNGGVSYVCTACGHIWS
ncbi:hypothetical protein [Streptomyces sp. SAJ15]|uniref:hypothetical protein n=1 Tax=Streptomyces sp. SAJ15 TaxID=2011095 RepID=UPI001185B9F6|nr:hypothetical protein [Streptomyces sp. SAJ15]TVL91868.1 hypothetical protein CD790_14360 [Streptomyces sp. SAJ15]